MKSGETPRINNEFDAIEIPSVADQELKLQLLVEQGVISPEEAQTVMLQQSAMNDVLTDPNLKKNQMDALQGLQEISDSGGHTLMDDANLQKISNQENSASKGRRQAILQNAESRGMGGAGATLMDQLLNEQEASTRKSERDLDVAAQSKERALQALIEQGKTAGNIRGQDFGEQEKIAMQNDAISKFNAANQQSQLNKNVDARNLAQTQNLANKQRVSDANVNMSNNQQQYNKELQQKRFQNELSKASGQTGVNTTNAANAGRDSQASADAWNKGMDKFLSGASMLAMSDEDQKTDVESFDPSEFLDSITGHKYKYKDPKFGKGEQVGVMAQDLEKTEGGAQMVEDTPQGKMVDYSKSGPPILASLADMHKRLKRLEEGF